jgi:hypothetical protein
MRYNKRAATLASQSSPSAPGATSFKSNAIIFLPALTTFSKRNKTCSASKPPATGVPVCGQSLGSKPSISKLQYIAGVLYLYQKK